MAIIISSLFAAFRAEAVTKEEMDRARAVTAQWYLRWANNGSDYLDNLEPKSMSELEGMLKEKEKQNIKAFKSVPVPTDYASWDKEKVVEYWSVTFFKADGLSEQGRGARARVKKRLSAMNFSDPTEVKPAEAEKTPEAEEGPVLPSAAPEDVAETQPEAEQIVEDAQAIDSTLLEAANQPQEEPKKEKSSTLWIYIVALIVLVGVVVWLVVFASKTMQGSGKDDEKEDARESEDKSSRPVRRRDIASGSADSSEYEESHAMPRTSTKDEKSLREKFASTLSVKDEEIRSLRREINGLREECMKLGEENGRLTSDLTLARRELEGLRGRLRAASAVSSASGVPAAEEQVEVTPRTRITPPEDRYDAPVKSSRRESVNKMDVTREIYLGRVNSGGLFVRADRKPVEGKSVFVLSTTDNYTGTYRVLQSAATIDMSLDNPEYYLAGGCVAADITNTAEADGIRTINSGTAIFEDGCWRVLRKAKIAYE